MNESLDLIVTRKLKEMNINTQTISFFQELLNDFLTVDYIILKPKVIAKKYNITHRQRK